MMERVVYWVMVACWVALAVLVAGHGVASYQQGYEAFAPAPAPAPAPAIDAACMAASDDADLDALCPVDGEDLPDDDAYNVAVK